MQEFNRIKNGSGDDVWRYIGNVYMSKDIQGMEREIFDRFDKDKNGTIEKKELANLAIALNNPLSLAELQDFFRAIDIDNSLYITWEEFIGYWQKSDQY